MHRSIVLNRMDPWHLEIHCKTLPECPSLLIKFIAYYVSFHHLHLHIRKQIIFNENCIWWDYQHMSISSMMSRFYFLLQMIFASDSAKSKYPWLCVTMHDLCLSRRLWETHKLIRIQLENSYLIHLTYNINISFWNTQEN